HRGDAGSDMHRNADNAVTCELALAGVQPSAYLKSQRVYPFADGTRATYRAGRAVEGGKQAVTGSVHLAAAKSGQLFSHHRVPVVAQLSPSRITHLRCALGRAHDVGEHDGGKHAVRLRAMAYSRDELLDLVGDDVLGLLITHEV